MKRFLFAGLAVLLAGSLAQAQDRENEVEGRVVELNDWDLVIKNEDGRNITINIRYVKEGDDWVRDEEQQASVHRRVDEGDTVRASFSWYEEKRYLREIRVIGGGNQEGLEEGHEIMVEGRVLRVGKRRGRPSLVLLVEGLRRELTLPRPKTDEEKALAAEVAALRTGYFVGVGYTVDGDNLMVNWVFLVRGGKVDRSGEWKDKRKAYMKGKGKEEEEDDEEKEWERRREKKEREREEKEHEEKERRKEAEKEKERRNKKKKKGD